MRVQKRAFSLIEILISLLIVGMIGSLTTMKFLSWKEHTRFTNDEKTLKALVFEAQMMTILSDSESDVLLTKRAGGGWQSVVEFSLPEHPLLIHINMNASHEFLGVKSLQGETAGEIRIPLYPPFGESECTSITLESWKGETKKFSLILLNPRQEMKQTIIDDTMIRSLEKSG